MTTLALTQSNVRSYSEIIAPWLAVVLAAGIGFSNIITMITGSLIALMCIFYMDRTTWSLVLKQPVAIAIFIFVAINLLDITYTIAANQEILQTMRKSCRLIYFLFLFPMFRNLVWQYRAVLAFIGVFLLSATLRCFDITMFRDSIYSSLFAAFTVFLLAHYSYENRRIIKLTLPISIFCVYFLFFVNHGRVGQYLFIMLLGLFVWQRFANNVKAQISAVALLCALICASFLGSEVFMSRQLQVVREITQYLQIDESEIPRESSMGIRLMLVHNTWDLIKQKPILGYGTASFKKAYAAYAPEKQAEWGQIKEPRANPHNQYLLTWLELGLPGLLSLLFVFFTMARFFWQHKNLNGYLGFGLTCAMVIGCTMNSWMMDFTSSFFFIFFAAMFYGGIFNNETQP